MLREIEPDGVREPASHGALRHPDGSINFDAYRGIARRARTAAMVSAVTGTMRIASAALSSIGNALAGKAVPTARHHMR